MKAGRIQREKRLIWKNPLFRGFAFLFYYLIATPLLFVFDKLFFGLKVEGKQYIRSVRGRGAIVVCNHVHYFDCTFLGMLIKPRRAIFTSLDRLFKNPILGPLLRTMGSVPVPSSPAGLRSFFRQMAEAVRGGRLACIYPEGELIMHCETLRDFKDGAFLIALLADVPVIPAVVGQMPRKGLWRLIKRKPRITITAGEPIEPVTVRDLSKVGRSADELPRREAHRLREMVYAQMAEMLRENRVRNGLSELDDDEIEKHKDHRNIENGRQHNDQERDCTCRD